MAAEKSYDNVLSLLRKSGYRFICPTPETHESYLKSLPNAQQTLAVSLTDVFGWSLPIKDSDLKAQLQGEIDAADLNELLDEEDGSGSRKPKVRVSTFCLTGNVSPFRKDDEMLYFHSSYPCTDKKMGGAFFGPDTYRYINFLSSAPVSKIIQSLSSQKIGIDLCCGPGAGAIALSRLHNFDRVIGLDLNPIALSLAKINARTAGSSIDFRESDFFSALTEQDRGSVDIVLCDPPFIPTSDATALYCDGGEEGHTFSIRVIEESLKVLQKNGLLVMYTGVSVKGSEPGKDPFLEACQKFVKEGRAELLVYDVVDNDVFGNEVGVAKGLGFIMVVGFVLRKI